MLTTDVLTTIEVTFMQHSILYFSTILSSLRKTNRKVQLVGANFFKALNQAAAT